MQLSEIKTKDQFYEFADIWYQRTHKLRDIWQNEDNTFERRAKSYILWLVMFERVMLLNQIAIKMNQTKPRNFKSGGITN